LKVLIDASNIKAGGGLQVAISFISSLLKRNVDEFEVYYMVSHNVQEQLLCKPKSDRLFVVTTDKATIVPFSYSAKRVTGIVKSINPDLVYTIFGPSFVQFKCKHIVGFANAWIVSPKSVAYAKFSVFKRCAVRVKNYILSRLLVDKHRFYITETEDIKEKMLEVLGINNEKVKVIPNALPYMYSEGFAQHNRPTVVDFESDFFNIITVSSNYPHKNLDIIPRVAKKMRERGYKTKFYVTIPESEYRLMPVEFIRSTVNLGLLSVEDCVQVYRDADLMFLPTLLECFSVSYLEAMYFSTPVCTSNFAFAKEVCLDAAEYFNPLDADDIFAKLEKLIIDPERYKEIQESSSKVISNHLSNEERTTMYINEIVRVLYHV
jgi:glycosyltransferase involved in cell wall biosynthesis